MMPSSVVGIKVPTWDKLTVGTTIAIQLSEKRHLGLEPANRAKIVKIISITNFLVPTRFEFIFNFQFEKIHSQKHMYLICHKIQR